MECIIIIVVSHVIYPFIIIQLGGTRPPSTNQFNRSIHQTNQIQII